MGFHFKLLAQRRMNATKRKDRQTKAKEKYEAEINKKTVIAKTDHCNLYHTVYCTNLQQFPFNNVEVLKNNVMFLNKIEEDGT